MNAIEFENITKYYSNTEQPAVNNVDLKIKKGEFIVILGSSGCGKTTLLKMINRLYEPTQGKIYINGIDSREVPVNTLRREMGYVIQQSGLFPHMTVAKNIATVPELLGWDKDKISKRIDFLLEMIHMNPKQYRKRYPSQLSGGQRQRVGLARALAADPPIMLMDEPFGAIDAITRTSLQDELINIQRKLRKTIIFVTHDVDEALRLADKIIIMDKGEVVQFDTPLNIIVNPKNEFVSGLLGEDDLIRQISLIEVGSIIEERVQTDIIEGYEVVSADTSLKTVLTLLLKSKYGEVYISNDNNDIIGKISFSDIQKLFSQNKSED